MAKVREIMIKVDDKPGAVASAIATLPESGVNIMSICAMGPMGVVQLIVDNPRKAAKALAAAGVAYTEGAAEMAELPNKPGSLHAHLARLAKKGVNLRSVCATASKSARKSIVVWTTDKGSTPH